MHPDLWTIPGIGFTIRTYGFFVGIGFLLALWIAMRRARWANCDPATISTMVLIGMVLGIIGCRAMYIVHHRWDALSAGQVPFRDFFRLSGGGEILGGVVLAIIGVIGYLLLTHKPVLRHLDVVFPSMILAMGIGRLGCLSYGCCWGGVCMTDAGTKALPWAIRFPYDSPAYERQVERNGLEIPEELMWRLPKTTHRTPIPREVLKKYSIDGDTLLWAWVHTKADLNEARAADPDGPEVARLDQALQDIQTKLKSRKPADLFSELAAVRHLYALNHRPGHAPVTWADLRQLASTQHSYWVQPTQLYDAIALTLLFFVLSTIFYRQRHPGMVVAWGMILYPLDRILQEMIRSDNPHDTFGLTISQFISLAVLVLGVVLAIVLVKKPVPSPVAEASRANDP